MIFKKRNKPTTEKKSLVQRVKDTIHFIQKDIWHLPLHELPPRSSFFIRQLRILLLAIKGFVEDKIQLRASALTLFSLLSIVPVLAVAFGIAKGFGVQNLLYEQLEGFAAKYNQESFFENIVSYSNNMLENTKGGLVAGIGVILIFWSVIKVLGHIENAFNQIWQIKKGRSFFRKFSDYIAFMLLAPILIIMSSGVTVFIKTMTGDIFLLSGIVEQLLKLFPYIIIWLLFTLIYIMMPNTKVNFKSGLVAGILAGTAFQLLQFGYITFQGYLTKYSVIYGTLSALPLFMMWLQISWLIVLFGAEISFANQNIEKYEYEYQSLHISRFYRNVLTVYVTHLMVKNFETGKPALTPTEFSQSLGMPIRLIRDIIFDLTKAGIASETVVDSGKENAYQPGMDITKLTVGFVLQKVESYGMDQINVDKSVQLRKISTIQEKFIEAINNHPENKLLKDI